MKQHALLALAVLTAGPTLATAGHAHHIRGICFFNQETMPCAVTEQPYTLRLLRVDGSTDHFTYAEQEDSFIGPEEAYWHVSHDRSRGLHLEDQYGKTVGFVEKQLKPTREVNSKGDSH